MFYPNIHKTSYQRKYEYFSYDAQDVLNLSLFIYFRYGCLQRVGRRHPELCMSLTPQLLQDHPFFDLTEKDVEDPACKLLSDLSI